MNDLNELFQSDPEKYGTQKKPTQDWFLELAKSGRSNWNNWRENANVKTRVKFDKVDFSNSEINIKDFAAFNFGDSASFHSCIFKDDFSFIAAKFDSSASFARCTFGKSVKFNGCQFGQEASFTGAEFKGDAFFNGAQFGKEAQFVCCNFEGKLSFVAWSDNQTLAFWNNTCKNKRDTDTRVETMKAHNLSSTIIRDASFNGSTFND